MITLKEKILKAVASDLEKIEFHMRRHLSPRSDLVKDVASHILFSGGKRLRPLLSILCSRLCGYADEDMYSISVIFEYLHAATLLHDDLIDEASIRRGETAAHMKWDSPTAVLTGDFLLAKSLMIASSTGNPEVIRVIANITGEMSQGEILQLQRRGSLDLKEKEYIEIIRCKTAVLFEGACSVSGWISESSENVINALGSFGFHLGMAFQMTDDLLDYTASSDSLGKEIGTDLKEGKLTLPLLHALKRAGSSDRIFMEEIIRQPMQSRASFDRLVSIINEYGGIEYTVQCATTHVEKARTALNSFNGSDAKEILLHIADYALSRNQ